MYKVLWPLGQISQNYIVTKFRIHLSDVIPAKVQKISPLVFFAYFCYFYREKTSYHIKFYISDHFSQTYEVVKFWMIDVIYVNGHTKHANCGLGVNVWNFLWMSFCFIMKKNHFKSCYVGLRSSLNFYFHILCGSSKGFMKDFKP